MSRTKVWEWRQEVAKYQTEKLQLWEKKKNNFSFLITANGLSVQIIIEQQTDRLSAAMLFYFYLFIF